MDNALVNGASLLITCFSDITLFSVTSTRQIIGLIMTLLSLAVMFSRLAKNDTGCTMVVKVAFMFCSN